MKIEGPKSANATGAAKGPRRAGQAGGAAFSDYLSETESTAGAGGIGAISPMAGMLGMLSVQASEDATARQQRQQAMDHAEDLLDKLDELRMGLLFGEYSPQQLENLARAVQNRRGQVENEPDLQATLDDIALRVAVELAKYQA